LVFQANTLLIAMVRRMPPRSRASFAPQGSSFQYGLEGPDNQAEVGAKLREEYQIRTTARADELLDLPSLMDGMRDHEQHEHVDGQHDHHDLGGDRESGAKGPLDLAAVRAKLQSKTGKQYWRTLEELSGDPEFEELLHREFPRHGAFRVGRLYRPARFPEVDGGIAGFCGTFRLRANAGAVCRAVLKQPDGMTLGKPQFYATAMPFGAGCDRFARGEPRRPADESRRQPRPSVPSLGATNVFAAGFDPESLRSGSRRRQ